MNERKWRKKEKRKMELKKNFLVHQKNQNNSIQIQKDLREDNEQQSTVLKSTVIRKCRKRKG